MELRRGRSQVVTCLFLLLWLPTMVWASSEKIRGVVRDGKTGQPLQGALVNVKATELTCLTNEQGEYVLHDVPVGKRTLVVFFEEYKKKKIKNVMVYPEQTTSRDITLFRTRKRPIEEELIIPEKPWVESKDGYQVWSLKGEAIEKLPVRELGEVVALFPGVVRQEGDFHIRGGRSDENAWRIDGVSARLPMSGNLGLRVIPNAIDGVSFCPGYNATIGLGMSGEIDTETKIGGQLYHLSGEMISDDFWAKKSQNYEILGINNLYSYGYNDYVLTVSGPMPGLEGLHFYLAGRRFYRASPATRFEGWKQNSLQIKGWWMTNQGVAVSDSMNLYANIPPGRLPGGGQSANTITGNFTWYHKPFKLRLGGSYFYRRSQPGANGDPLELYVTPVRGRRYRLTDYSGYLHFEHQATPTLHYHLNLSTFYNGSVDGDPIWWDDIRKLGDPVYNTAVLDTGVIKYWRLPIGLSLRSPGAPITSFNKFDQSYWGGRLNMFKQFGKNIDVTLGGEFNYYTVRRYSIQTIGMLGALSGLEMLKGTPDEIPDYHIYHQYGSVQNYGYDIYGDKINNSQSYKTNVNGRMVSFDGHDGPPHPITAASYIQGKVELSNLVLNGGVRFDLFDTGTNCLKDWREIQQDSTRFISEESFEDRSPYTFFSPRLGASFPLADRTVLHAQIGRYVTMPRLADVFESWGYFAHTLFADCYRRQFPNPNLKPVKMTQYEMGWQRQFGEKASFGITAFYKTYQDLARTGILESNVHGYLPVIMTQNDDFSNVKGLTFDFYLYRTRGVMLAANYTLSCANGTGSASDSHFKQAFLQTEDFLPILVAPLDFEQRHRGMIDVDIRTQPKDGPRLFGKRPLGNLGLNLLFTFHSGAPFTRIQSGSNFSEVYGYLAAQPIETPNASNLPWFYQLDAKLDKTFSIGLVDFNLYLWVLNLLNTKSVIAVFQQTGRPDSDGYLETEGGKNEIQYYGEDYKRWYQALLTNCGSFGWQVPRQVRLGLRFELK